MRHAFGQIALIGIASTAVVGVSAWAGPPADPQPPAPTEWERPPREVLLTPRFQPGQTARFRTRVAITPPSTPTVTIDSESDVRVRVEGAERIVVEATVQSVRVTVANAPEHVYDSKLDAQKTNRPERLGDLAHLLPDWKEAVGKKQRLVFDKSGRLLLRECAHPQQVGLPGESRADHELSVLNLFDGAEKSDSTPRRVSDKWVVRQRSGAGRSGHVAATTFEVTSIRGTGEKVAADIRSGLRIIPSADGPIGQAAAVARATTMTASYTWDVSNGWLEKAEIRSSAPDPSSLNKNLDTLPRVLMTVTVERLSLETAPEPSAPIKK